MICKTKLRNIQKRKKIVHKAGKRDQLMSIMESKKCCFYLEQTVYALTNTFINQYTWICFSAILLFLNWIGKWENCSSIKGFLSASSWIKLRINVCTAFTIVAACWENWRLSCWFTKIKRIMFLLQYLTPRWFRLVCKWPKYRPLYSQCTFTETNFNGSKNF